MKFAWLWGASSRAAISTASCSDPTGLLAKNSLLRCDSVSDDRVTGDGSLAIVEISEGGVYVGMAVVVAAAVVAALVVAAVVVAAVVVAAVVAAAVVVAAVVVAPVVVAAVVAAAVVVAAVVVAAAAVESRLVAAVVVVKEASKYMASSSTAAMSLIDVNGMSVVGYG